MKFLLIATLSLSASAFASDNMVPVLNCKLTKDEIAKVAESGSNEPDGFALVAPLSSLGSKSEVKGMIVLSGRLIGVQKTENDIVSNFLNGKIFSKNITDSGLKTGEIFREDVVDYNDQYKWQKKYIIKKVGNDTAQLEVKTISLGESDVATTQKYNCTIPTIFQ